MTRRPAEPRSSFYPGWILANAWAEAAGLGTTLLLGRALAPALERQPGPGAVILGALGAVGLGVVLEGVVVGWAQGRVLHGALPALSVAGWVKATAIGAGVAWLLGMVPSTAFALLVTGPAAGPGPGPGGEPPPAVRYGLALALGAVTGPLLGLGQWVVLRRHVAHAGRWIGANAAAWALGMAVIFLAMDLVPWTRGGAAVVLGVYLGCGLAGVVAGAVHGRVLRDLLQRAVSPPPAAG